MDAERAAARFRRGEREGGMIELDTGNYDREVLAHKGVVLVDFWSDSCEECLAAMPEIEALEGEFGARVRFGKVNIQGNRRLAIREKVLGLPTVLLYRDGERKGAFSRGFTAAEVRAALQELARA